MAGDPAGEAPADTVLADPGRVADLVDVLGAADEGLLAAWVADEAAVPAAGWPGRWPASPGAAWFTRCSSARPITGAGIGELAAGIARLLPLARGDAAGPVSASIFKVERGPAGEKIAYARVFSGTLRVRDQLSGPDGGGTGRTRTTGRAADHGPA